MRKALPTLITWVMSRVSFAQRGRASGGFTAALFAGEFISPIVVIALQGGQPESLPAALTLIAVGQLLLALICWGLPWLFRSLAEPPATTAAATRVSADDKFDALRKSSSTH